MNFTCSDEHALEASLTLYLDVTPAGRVVIAEDASSGDISCKHDCGIHRISGPAFDALDHHVQNPLRIAFSQVDDLVQLLAGDIFTDAPEMQDAVRNARSMASSIAAAFQITPSLPQ